MERKREQEQQREPCKQLGLQSQLPILGFNKSYSRAKRYVQFVPPECYAGSSMVKINFKSIIQV